VVDASEIMHEDMRTGNRQLGLKLGLVVVHALQYRRQPIAEIQ